MRGSRTASGVIDNWLCPRHGGIPVKGDVGFLFRPKLSLHVEHVQNLHIVFEVVRLTFVFTVTRSGTQLRTRALGAQKTRECCNYNAVGVHLTRQ